jgi:hypothetical protein
MTKPVVIREHCDYSPSQVCQKEKLFLVWNLILNNTTTLRLRESDATQRGALSNTSSLLMLSEDVFLVIDAVFLAAELSVSTPHQMTD